MAEAMRQVGADGGGNARTEAPACQGWYGLVPSAGIKREHARRQDEAVHGEGDESGGQAGLAVRANEFVDVAVGDDPSDGRYRQGGNDPDEAVRHRATPLARRPGTARRRRVGRGAVRRALGP